MLDLTRSLNHKKEERKEKNGLKLNFLSFPSLFFSLSLLSLSFMSIFFFTYTREARAAAIVFLCMFAFRKQETILLYLRLYKKLYYSNFRTFCQGQMHAMVNFTFSFFETLIQNLVTHCHYYLVRECHVLQSLLQNCTCPHKQGGATGCHPSMAASFRMKRPTHCRQ